MSQISAIFGTDDDDEILNSLYIIANVSFTCSVIYATLMGVRSKRIPTD